MDDRLGGTLSAICDINNLSDSLEALSHGANAKPCCEPGIIGESLTRVWQISASLDDSCVAASITYENNPSLSSEPSVTLASATPIPLTVNSDASISLTYLLCAVIRV